MRKQVFTLLIPIGLFFSIGCTQQEKTNNESQKITTQSLKNEIDSSGIYKQEAIKLLDEVNSTVSKSIKGEVSQEATNKEINPKMEKFFELMTKMSPNDTIEVHNYRVKELNKLIDLQVEQNQR